MSRGGAVEEVSSLATLRARVRRSEFIDEDEAGGIGVGAAVAVLSPSIGAARPSPTEALRSG